MLRPLFDQVLTASDPEQADAHLAENAVSHVVCGYHLGIGLQTGAELIARWRRRHPGLKRAILCTGSNPDDVSAGSEVDAVLRKPTNRVEVAEALGIEVERVLE